MICTLWAGTAGMLLHINEKFTMGKIEIISFVVRFPSLTTINFDDLCQGMKQTYLYMWHPSFQTQ